MAARKLSRLLKNNTGLFQISFLTIMKRLIAYGIALVVWLGSLNAAVAKGHVHPDFRVKSKHYKVKSPDGKTVFEIATDKARSLVYRMHFNGKAVLDWSSLGLAYNGAAIGKDTRILERSEKHVSETFRWAFGENDSITNNYNEFVLSCRSADVKFRLVARVYNNSVAFRYEIPSTKEADAVVITGEHTDFRFTKPYTLYQYKEESVFTETPIAELNKTSDFPSTLAGNGQFLSIGEAGNLTYTKAVLVNAGGGNALGISFGKDTVRTSGSFISPWRTCSIAVKAIGLHAFSDLQFRLVDARPGTDVGWIKPGKLIRSALTTQAGLDCIDFAAKNHLQYIMYDAGWYGPEFKKESDASKVIPAIDMQKVIDYGKSKHIGVILYVNYVALRQHIDALLPMFQTWGVSGLKFGFVDGISQAGISWLSTAIEKVQKHGLILDIHDNYKPTGLSHIFPNLLTQEGVRGNENNPDAYHNTMLPFTRFLAGPADYTFCYPNANPKFTDNLLKTKLQVSKAQQLALSVIYYSPLQAIFWYGNPNDYTNEREIEFFREVPTTWNETKYLDGTPGRYVSVARRNGTTWFVGSAAGNEALTSDMHLDFLLPGKTYLLTSYEDDGQQIVKKTKTVRKDDRWPVILKAKGGQAIRIIEQ